MHRIRRPLRLVRAVPLAVLCAACAPRPYPYQAPAPTGHAVRCGGYACKDSVGVTYLGSGGFVIRHGDDAILTAPFLSAPRAPQLLLPLRANRARVDSLVRAWVGDTAAVRAVLVGHTHYDHVLDLPYIFQRWLTNPAVHAYGSRALAYTFAADRGFRTRIQVVEDSAGTIEREGGWVRVPGFRFMPLRSDHAPHIAGIPLLPRRIRRPLPYRPWWMLSYPQGTTLAYLVDVTDASGKVVFRLHYQDAASAPPRGFPPTAELRRHRVDLAILCGASYAQVRDYPNVLLDTLRPRNAVVGHWEDFLLRNRRNPPPGVPATDYADFEARLADAPVGNGHPWVPVPGETRWFCTCPEGAP